MVNGDNKTKQIYKINISYLDFALQKKKKKKLNFENCLEV